MKKKTLHECNLARVIYSRTWWKARNLTRIHYQTAIVISHIDRLSTKCQKVCTILHLFCFSLLCDKLICLGNLLFPFHQSDTKLKLITTWSQLIFEASNILKLAHVYFKFLSASVDTFSHSDRKAIVIYLILVVQQVIRKCSNPYTYVLTTVSTELPGNSGAEA